MLVVNNFLGELDKALKLFGQNIPNTSNAIDGHFVHIDIGGAS